MATVVFGCSYFIDRIEGNKVYLNIRLAERHKLPALITSGSKNRKKQN